MSSAAETLEHVEPREHYLNVRYGVKSWLLTVDHKRIAILYLVGVTIFFAIGGVFAALIRMELLTPEGDLFQSETYNKLFTTHGVMMVFFFMIPAIPSVLGNFLIPLMIGARDLAFPRINLLSFYLYLVGGLLALWAVIHGGVDTGWTFYTPYSTVYSNGWVVVTAVGIFIAGFSSILTGLNFLVTIHTMRAPGLDVDALAPLRLGALRHQRSSSSSERRSLPSRSCWSPPSASSTSASSTRARAATRCSSSTSSGSTRTRPSTS